MGLFLEITAGPHTGARAPISVGMKIGRKQGAVLLSDDAKVSGVHAEVKEVVVANKTLLILEDCGSANGIWVENNRVQKVTLLPGVLFRIGNSYFKIFEELSAEIVPTNPFKKILNDLMLPVPDVALEHFIFNPCLQLNFLQGPHIGENWLLAYGPRIFGSLSWDLEVQDPLAPTPAFQLVPAEFGAVLHDLSREKIFVNGRPVKKNVLLTAGDQIQVGNSVIEIRYVDKPEGTEPP